MVIQWENFELSSYHILVYGSTINPISLCASNDLLVVLTTLNSHVFDRVLIRAPVEVVDHMSLAGLLSSPLRLLSYDPSVLAMPSIDLKMALPAEIAAVLPALIYRVLGATTHSTLC